MAKQACNPNDVGRIRTKIRSLGQASGPVVERAMEHIANILLKEAKELVPIETGALWASGRLIWERRGLRTDVYVAFGGMGFGIDYGVLVHEDLTKSHGAAYNSRYAREIARGRLRAKRPQETAKFLEIAMKTKLTAMKIAFRMFIGRPMSR